MDKSQGKGCQWTRFITKERGIATANEEGVVYPRGNKGPGHGMGMKGMQWVGMSENENERGSDKAGGREEEGEEEGRDNGD